jgi:hypothetical protein
MYRMIDFIRWREEIRRTKENAAAVPMTVPPIAARLDILELDPLAAVENLREPFLPRADRSRRATLRAPSRWKTRPPSRPTTR